MVQSKPLVFTFTSDWSYAVSVFACLLREELGGDVVAVTATPEEDVAVYDSNVLAVLRSGEVEKRWKVLEVARRVEKKFGDKIGINPLIVTEKEADRFPRHSSKAERLLREAEKDLEEKCYNKAVSALYFSLRMLSEDFLQELRTPHPQEGRQACQLH